MYGFGVVAALVALGALGYQLGQKKDRALEGLLLGGLLGVLGLVILYFLKPKHVAAAQSWGATAEFGVAAPQAYAQPVSAAYGQSVLPGGAVPAPAVQANPYAPTAGTAGYGYEQPVPVAQPEPVAPVAAAVPAQWFADPAGRHQHRYWDGSAWTEHVADNGVVTVDAPLPATF